MLKTLKIEQFVIIDKLALDFQDRLTIFTGETGAGKSIILGAMGLILGNESNPKAIRQGSEQSIFEATFAPKKDHPAWTYLSEHQLVDAGANDFNIHRVMNIAEDGKKDEIRINDKAIEIETLKELGELLVEIHGQFANQSLLGPDNQLNLLDLSGHFPPEFFKNVADALSDVHRYTKELEEEKLFLARHKGRELKKIEAIVGRFDKIGMKEGFIPEVIEEHEILRTAKETSEAFQRILGRLISANGVVVSLSGANKTLAEQENLDDEKMVHLEKCLSESLRYARDAVQEMGRLLPEYEIDLAPLTRLEKILEVLNNISKDTKVPFDDLSEYWAVQDAKLRRVRNGREKLAEIEKNLIEAKKSYRHHAHILTEKRIAAGEDLSKRITAEFVPLMLNKAEFEVLVEEKPDAEWTDRGFNEVTFKARMNPGSPLTPISETASGGELARMILALKVVLQRVQTTPTLVFDEVDTGIGGAAAAAVGERIAHLADTTQVLVITHSPQVASRGDQHFHISKKTDGVTTTSAVHTLSPEERIEEISRMLAGDVLTEESQAAAKSLIDEAQTAAKARRGE